MEYSTVLLEHFLVLVFLVFLLGSDIFQKYFVTKIKSYYSCKFGSIRYKLLITFLKQSIYNIPINKPNVAITCNEFAFKIYIFQTKGIIP